MKIYQIVLIVIGSILLYLFIGYFTYKLRVYFLKRQGKWNLLTEGKRTEIFCYHLFCTIPIIFLEICTNSSIPYCCFFNPEDNIPSIPTSEALKNPISESQEGIPNVKEGILEREEIITKEEAKNKISQLITDKNFVNVNWISIVTLIPIDTVCDLISQEEFYHMEGDKVIRRKITTGICPECNSHYSTETEYCPNCGERLTKKSIG